MPLALSPLSSPVPPPPSLSPLSLPSLSLLLPSPVQLSYSGEVLRSSAGSLVEVLAEAASEPLLRTWEVEEAKASFSVSVEASASSPVTALLEGVHAAAYGRSSALGHGHFAAPEDLAALNSAVLADFLGSRALGGNAVLSGINVSHEALLGAARKFLSRLPQGASAAPAAPAYSGGEQVTRTRKGGLAHAALALPGPGLASGSKLHAAGVLQALLGSSSSRAAGGASRLAALQSGSVAGQLSAFALPLSDSGLLGVAGSCEDSELGKLLALLASALTGAARTAPSAQELARAKASYKLALLAGSDSRAGAREELAGSLLLSGSKPASAAELSAAIEALTAQDVSRVAQAALASAPSVVALGSLATLPSYTSVAKLLQ